MIYIKFDKCHFQGVIFIGGFSGGVVRPSRSL